ncbi:MAG: hypothetical protein ACE5IE_03700 [Dehalococcoidia bacterium]
MRTVQKVAGKRDDEIEMAASSFNKEAEQRALSILLYQRTYRVTVEL